MLATEVVAEDFAKWRYYRAIQLNTSATGATVSGDVRNFPVAVALSADNFDFNQAKADGADLRFSVEQNGATLPCHIESWVRTNQSALVWVKVPVVRGNSADQKIFMHWGNEAMNDAGDSKAVFDMKDGFVGAWHLSDEGGMEDGGYKDAAANAAHGTGVNMARSSRVDARVGRGAWGGVRRFAIPRTSGFGSAGPSARPSISRIAFVVRWAGRVGPGRTACRERSGAGRFRLGPLFRPGFLPPLPLELCPLIPRLAGLHDGHARGFASHTRST